MSIASFDQHKFKSAIDASADGDRHSIPSQIAFL
jgi:hypothetical protein